MEKEELFRGKISEQLWEKLIHLSLHEEKQNGFCPLSFKGWGFSLLAHRSNPPEGLPEKFYDDTGRIAYLGEVRYSRESEGITIRFRQGLPGKIMENLREWAQQEIEKLLLQASKLEIKTQRCPFCKKQVKYAFLYQLEDHLEAHLREKITAKFIEADRIRIVARLNGGKSLITVSEKGIEVEKER